MYNSIGLKNIKAKGWAAEYLKTQSSGMTGHLDEVIEPFCTKYWDSENLSVTEGETVFLGGMDEVEGIDKWVFYEQTGYWIDGMVKCAHLIDDEWLYEKVKPKLYLPIEKADDDGYIGPLLLKDGMTWAHTIYFRALMAEYEATENTMILETLKKHFLRVPLKDVYKKNHDVRIMTVRDVADIEVALWIYGKTKDVRFLNMAEESYECFNEIYSDDNNCAEHEKMRALTIHGMLEEGNARDNHGVTYCEICKLAAILHMYTGKEFYKQAAINAFDKVYRSNMLIDGVISSTEYLNGNDDSRASHETCDVADFTWALGYLYMISGDTKYSDWIENAIFNGGFGSVSDDFKSNQYFSCPNQVLCDDNSNHNEFYRGENWMSYAPENCMACCTGNVNRFFPNFIYRSWLQDENTIAPLVYAPTEASFNIDKSFVTICEETAYPFENDIKFSIKTQDPVHFCLKLRVPEWAVKSTLYINGESGDVYLDGNIYCIKREFNDGDVMELSFEDEICFVENVGGISVKKGGLLYALPIEERTVIEPSQRGVGNPEYPHYSLYAMSKWNYGLSEESIENAKFNDGKIDGKPWISTCNDMKIILPAHEIKEWVEEKNTKVIRKLNPRRDGKIVDCECTFTPLIPEKGSFEFDSSVSVALVPYCTTRLRISIFPDCRR